MRPPQGTRGDRCGGWSLKARSKAPRTHAGWLGKPARAGARGVLGSAVKAPWGPGGGGPGGRAAGNVPALVAFQEHPASEATAPNDGRRWRPWVRGAHRGQGVTWGGPGGEGFLLLPPSSWRRADRQQPLPGTWTACRGPEQAWGLAGGTPAAGLLGPGSWSPPRACEAFGRGLLSLCLKHGPRRGQRALLPGPPAPGVRPSSPPGCALAWSASPGLRPHGCRSLCPAHRGGLPHPVSLLGMACGGGVSSLARPRCGRAHKAGAHQRSYCGQARGVSNPA